MTELYESVLLRAKEAINAGNISEETQILVDMVVKLHGCLFPGIPSAQESEAVPTPSTKPQQPKLRRRKAMTDEELLAMDKITPEIAAAYLQNGTNAQFLRLDAQKGSCPFMQAIRNKGRYSYRVNVGLLIKYKHGELGLHGNLIDD